MTHRAESVEWVEGAEVVIIQECIPSVANNHTVASVIPILEPEGANIQKLLDSVVPGESHGFCCEECMALFQDHNDSSNVNGPSFILDYPTTMDVPQRALLTLPFGLMIGRSSIPNAGVGVINHGPTLCPGMHFGPYEGDVVSKENALSSCFSWEINKGENGYTYVDASIDDHSNWMRYVNSARNKDEANLIAVQYKGTILFHCCGTIHAGDELTVWPSSKMLDQFSEDWTQFWFSKLNIRENNTTPSTQIFLCPSCQLSFTTESYLQRHIENRHSSSCVAVIEAEDEQSIEELTDGPSDNSNTCPDCGKTFNQNIHLRRHILRVHSIQRPFCCSHCNRTFTQASSLIRHQLVHKKPMSALQQDQDLNETETQEIPTPEQAEDEIEKEEGSNQVVCLTVDVNAPEVPLKEPIMCPNCDKPFFLESNLKKHVALVHGNFRPYVCSFCQKGFRQYSDLSRHLKSHKNQKQQPKKGVSDEDILFSCPICLVTEPSVEKLKEHIKSEHPDVVFVESEKDEPDVEEKGVKEDSPMQEEQEEIEETKPALPVSDNQRPKRLKAISNVSALTRDMGPKKRKVKNTATLTKETPSSTESCPETEAQSDSGQKTAKKFKWFGCNRCRRTYPNIKLLRSHTCSPKQLKCLQCGVVFNKIGFLKRHERTAHADTNYNPRPPCDRCGKVFSSASKLKNHQKKQNCDKYLCKSEVFPCPICPFSFSIKTYLVKHIRRHHPIDYLSHQESETLVELGMDQEERVYKCPLCDKSYASAQALKNHACVQQTKILYLCTDCGKGFTNKYGLKQHQRIHTGEKPNNCPHCPKTFAHVGQLNVHLRTHTGEKPYLCTHCGDSFRQSGDLKRHERRHTGIRPHTCPECGKGFSRPTSLKAHIMLHLGQRIFKCTQCGKSFSRNYHLRRHHQKMHS
ncbi:unnamed protein product [Knipowitschia caucasica]